MLKILKVEIQSRILSKRLFHKSKSYSKTSSIIENQHESHLKILEQQVKKLRIYDEIDLMPADLDWNYLLNEENLSKIEKNCQIRKSNGDIKALVRFPLVNEKD